MLDRRGSFNRIWDIAAPVALWCCLGMVCRATWALFLRLYLCFVHMRKGWTLCMSFLYMPCSAVLYGFFCVL